MMRSTQTPPRLSDRVHISMGRQQDLYAIERAVRALLASRMGVNPTVATWARRVVVERRLGPYPLLVRVVDRWSGQL